MNSKLRIRHFRVFSGRFQTSRRNPAKVRFRGVRWAAYRFIPAVSHGRCERDVSFRHNVHRPSLQSSRSTRTGRRRRKQARRLGGAGGEGSIRLAQDARGLKLASTRGRGTPVHPWAFPGHLRALTGAVADGYWMED